MDPNAPPPTPEFLAANRWSEFFVPATVTFALSCVALVLRFAAGFVAQKKLWLDDYFAIIAAINGLGIYITTATVWKSIGYGRHIIAALQEHPNAVTTLLKTIFALEQLYAAALTAAKCSIICFLWRIFSKTTMRWYLIGLLCIVLCWYVGVVLISIFNCVPVRAFWDLTITDKKCFDTYKSYVGISWPNMFTDFALTLLPIPYVLRLQISIKQKVLVAVTLICGGATCIISAIRLANIMNNFSLADPTWDSVTLMKWTAIEIYCAIMAICLPTLRPLVRLISKKGLESTPASSRPSNPTIGSKRFGFNSSGSSKKYRSADVTDETDSERALAFAETTTPKNPDGFGVQSFPMNAIEVTRQYEVR